MVIWDGGINAECFLGVLKDEAREKGRGHIMKLGSDLWVIGYHRRK